MASGIDHVSHGWALLAMRLPELRSLAKQRHRVAEMCECYSIAAVELRRLRIGDSNAEYVAEYEELVAGIEQEVCYYLTQFTQRRA